MNNSIDRQLAIDTAIDAVDSWDGGCNKEREKIIREALEKLPPAQPETSLMTVKSTLEPEEIERIVRKIKDTSVMILPPAEPERKKGKWIPVTNGRGGHECSLCHGYAPSFQSGNEWLTDYCPNCGEYMKGDQDGRDC